MVANLLLPASHCRERDRQFAPSRPAVDVRHARHHRLFAVRLLCACSLSPIFCLKRTRSVSIFLLFFYYNMLRHNTTRKYLLGELMKRLKNAFTSRRDGSECALAGVRIALTAHLRSDLVANQFWLRAFKVLQLEHRSLTVRSFFAYPLIAFAVGFSNILGHR